MRERTTTVREQNTYFKGTKLMTISLERNSISREHNSISRERKSIARERNR